MVDQGSDTASSNILLPIFPIISNVNNIVESMLILPMMLMIITVLLFVTIIGFTLASFGIHYIKKYKNKYDDCHSTCHRKKWNFKILYVFSIIALVLLPFPFTNIIGLLLSICILISTIVFMHDEYVLQKDDILQKDNKQKIKNGHECSNHVV
jgi:hypothetical protein